MKKNPIETHKIQDLTLIRDKLLTIINGDVTNATMAKTVVEAGKLLARMHHALQVDKTVQKIEQKKSEEKKEKHLSPDESARIDDILKEFHGLQPPVS